MPTTLRHCTTCGEERVFEQPPCADGHDSGCPEWLCVDCGYAVIAEFDISVDDDTSEPLGWAA